MIAGRLRRLFSITTPVSIPLAAELRRYTATYLVEMKTAFTGISLVTAIDPPWTDITPIRLGAVPSSIGTPDRFALVALPGRPPLRVDLYRAYDSELYLRDEILPWQDWIAIGFGHRAFLIHTQHHDVREISIPLYFEGFRAAEDYLLVLAGQGLVRIDQKGAVVWKNADLAIDGVEIDAIESGVICGRGEWDPPGDWRPFRVRLDTGDVIARAV